MSPAGLCSESRLCQPCQAPQAVDPHHTAVPPAARWPNSARSTWPARSSSCSTSARGASATPSSRCSTRWTSCWRTGATQRWAHSARPAGSAHAGSALAGSASGPGPPLPPCTCAALRAPGGCAQELLQLKGAKGGAEPSQAGQQAGHTGESSSQVGCPGAAPASLPWLWPLMMARCQASGGICRAHPAAQATQPEQGAGLGRSCLAKRMMHAGDEHQRCHGHPAQGAAHAAAEQRGEWQAGGGGCGRRSIQLRRGRCGSTCAPLHAACSCAWAEPPAAGADPTAWLAGRLPSHADVAYFAGRSVLRSQALGCPHAARRCLGCPTSWQPRT